ncbi:hypothetical protein [Leptospira neocaledonica]|uniref:hypothetical protein n=1 Tax=Leptospira neocaledonica TaxID=2023192 RepID=UPI000F646093|nr:hypothetical protein [Leptospira neocaledonica]
MGINDLRSGNTFVFSKKGTAVFIIDPEICIKKERAMIGEYIWANDGLYIYLYKSLQLEGGDLDRIKKKCESGVSNLEFEEKLILMNTGSLRFIDFKDFKQEKNDSDFEDVITFKTGENEFYQFNQFPAQFQEIVDYEIKEERRLHLKNGNLQIQNKTDKTLRFSDD